MNPVMFPYPNFFFYICSFHLSLSTHPTFVLIFSLLGNELAFTVEILEVIVKGLELLIFSEN